MSNLDRATFRVTHSLRRKAAGEHHIPTTTLIEAFSGEWALKPHEIAQLYRAAVEQERQSELRKK